MKSPKPPLLLITVMAMGLASTSRPAQARETVLFDQDWRFHLGDVTGAERESYRDRKWRPVNLPHDWSIEHETNPEAPGGGSMGFFPGGVGCYRKTFHAPDFWQNRRVWIEFEGVYENAEVWINGHFLGAHPYGYTPFTHDLTSYLNFGSNNTLLVRVDNSRQPNSRWYTGSGIYRHVWLKVLDPIHLVADGVFVSPEAVSPGKATLRVELDIRNQADAPRTITGEIKLIDPAGGTAASLPFEGQVPADSHLPQTCTVTISNPKLWSPETPRLYTAITRVQADGHLADELTTPFGIRSLRATATNGFEINGRTLNLVGGNVHHDNGPLGAAAFDRAEERKVEILKAAGFNAVRTAHNPPSPAFLRTCDRLGVLVIDEAFDGWAKKKTRHDYATVFHDRWQSDLTAMVRRDRNHPSVVMWSIGNEVYERGNATGAEIARHMRSRIRELDMTRPITAGINGLGESGDWPQLDPLFAALDVAGYNYETARAEADHARLPRRVIMLTETYPSAMFTSWEAVNGNAYVIGDFVWSALDYLGEAGIGRVFRPRETPVPHWEGRHYPWHGAACGIIDLVGWRKPMAHYHNIIWNRDEKLYAAVVAPAPGGAEWSLSKWSMPPALSSWTWPGQEGKPIRVEAYSRHEAVRLYVNGARVGEKPTTRAQKFRASFDVVYTPGTLRVVGLEEGKEVEDFVLETAGEAASIRLSPDREQIHADGQDLCFVRVEIVDREGRLRPDSNKEIKYRLRGPGEIIGIGSDDLASQQSYQANPRRAYQGRALVILRSTGKRGKITLTATGSGLQQGKTTISATTRP